MRASSSVTKMQSELGMANGCYKMECSICNNLFKMESGKIS